MDLKKIDGKTLFLLIAILALASWLRFYRLGDVSFVNDELETLRKVSFPTLSQTLEKVAVEDVHPPGFYVLEYFSARIFGFNEFGLRLPSAIFGILAVAAIFFLARYMFSTKIGLLSAAFSAVLWAPLFYSQEARAYSALFLFSIITTRYLLEIVDFWRKNESPPKEALVFYFLAAVFTSYLHYIGLSLIVLQGVFAFFALAKTPKIKSAFLIFGAVALCYLPWLPYAVAQYANASGWNWIKPPTFFSFGFYLAFLYNLSPYVLGVALIFYAIYLAKFVKNKLWREKERAISPDLYLILWALVPFLVIFVKSLVSRSALTYYSLLISAPAFYVGLARAVDLSARSKTITNALAFAFFALAFFNLIFDYNYYGDPYKDSVVVFGKKFKKRTKEQFADAAKYVADNFAKYPNSYLAAYVWRPDYFEYYFSKFGFRKKIDFSFWNPEKVKSLSPDSLPPSVRYLWLLRGHKILELSITNFLDSNYERIKRIKLVRADVFVYKKRERKN